MSANAALPERVEQLQRADGTLIEVYLCTVCLTWAHGSAAVAHLCCAPRVCGCGEPLSKTRSQCDACWSKQRAAKEAAIFAAAAKVFAEDYTGAMVYVEDDEAPIETIELAERLDELRSDWQADNPDEPIASYTSPRVYATRVQQHIIDGSGVIEDVLDDAHEDAHDSVDSAAELAFNQYLRAWSVQHLPVTYYENSSTALVFAPVDVEASA